MEQTSWKKHQYTVGQGSPRPQRLSACHPKCPADCNWVRMDTGIRKCRIYTAPSCKTVLWKGTCYFYGLEPLPEQPVKKVDIVPLETAEDLGSTHEKASLANPEDIRQDCLHQEAI
jgi:hypothetical protein